MNQIIKRERSIIPACDVDLEIYEDIVKETAGIDAVGGYKIGFQLALAYGLPAIVDLTREYSDKPLIYDHQKAGTDIPDTGKNFARIVKGAGIDAVILFPQSGPETLKSWVEAAREQKLDVIVGGLMTHPKYTESEGGYLSDKGVMQIYTDAVKLGISDFVVPGNKPDSIRNITNRILDLGIKNPVFYSPGFVKQGGVISDAAIAVAGCNWHAIVGRGLYEASDIRKAALDLTSQI